MSPECGYKLTGLSLEPRSPGRVLAAGEGEHGIRINSPLPWQSPWHTSPASSSQPSPHFALVTPPVREEQRGAQAREPLSFSKGNGISELNDEAKEAFGEQGSGVSFLHPHARLGRMAAVYYTQQRLDSLDTYREPRRRSLPLTRLPRCPLILWLPHPGGHQNLYK